MELVNSGYTWKMDPISIYLHIPFCKHRCGYCDFNTYAGLDNLIPEYVDALVDEIVFFAAHKSQKLNAHTIFFGGGTPSLLTISQIEKIMNAIGDSFNLTADMEVSLEANPGTVDFEYFSNIRSMGINRLSMGVQSANSIELKILERQHGYSDAILAMEEARRAGFENISLDLIFGLPNQVLADWKENLIKAFSLTPDHISLYSLTVEKGTPLEKQVKNGIYPYPDDDVAADMYEWTMDFLGENGFAHYEISNWAKICGGGEINLSRHNLQYWKNKPYIGFGAGAHSSIGGYRFSNILTPRKYINQMSEMKPNKFPRTPTSIEVQLIDKEVAMNETMMMGLRLLQQGVAKNDFKIRFGQDLEETFKDEIRELLKKELLKWGGDSNQTLLLTKRGRVLGNQVFMKFV